MREAAAIVNALQKDKLTGLYNRETFFEMAEAMILASEPEYYVMACLDIDNFKVINDLYGSARGDLVLKHVAAAFSEGMNALGGICGRIAADHFAVLYPSSLMGSRQIDDIRSRAELPQVLLQPMTISVGRYVVTDRRLPSAACTTGPSSPATR